MTSPIVINIHGAKLLSSELSKNARIDPRAKSKITSRHRIGANGATVKAICAASKYTPMATGKIIGGKPVFAAYHRDGPFPVRSVTLTRICPTRYMSDGDNASTLLSATRDGVADALGVNDKVFVDNPTEEQLQNGKIGIRYEQIDGPWGVRITIEPR